MTNKVEANVFGNWVYNTRTSYGWSRYRLAKESGIQESHLAKIEEGAYCCRIDVVQKIVSALNPQLIFPLNV